MNPQNIQPNTFDNPYFTSTKYQNINSGKKLLLVKQAMESQLEPQARILLIKEVTKLDILKQHKMHKLAKIMLSMRLQLRHGEGKLLIMLPLLLLMGKDLLQLHLDINRINHFSKIMPMEVEQVEFKMLHELELVKSEVKEDLLKIKLHK